MPKRRSSRAKERKVTRDDENLDSTPILTATIVPRPQIPIVDATPLPLPPDNDSKVGVVQSFADHMRKVRHPTKFIVLSGNKEKANQIYKDLTEGVKEDMMDPDPVFNGDPEVSPDDDLQIQVKICLINPPEGPPLVDDSEDEDGSSSQSTCTTDDASESEKPGPSTSAQQGPSTSAQQGPSTGAQQGPSRMTQFEAERKSFLSDVVRATLEQGFRRNLAQGNLNLRPGSSNTDFSQSEAFLEGRTRPSAFSRAPMRTWSVCVVLFKEVLSQIPVGDRRHAFLKGRGRASALRLVRQAYYERYRSRMLMEEYEARKWKVKHRRSIWVHELEAELSALADTVGVEELGALRRLFYYLAAMEPRLYILLRSDILGTARQAAQFFKDPNMDWTKAAWIVDKITEIVHLSGKDLGKKGVNPGGLIFKDFINPTIGIRGTILVEKKCNDDELVEEEDEEEEDNKNEEEDEVDE